MKLPLNAFSKLTLNTCALPALALLNAGLICAQDPAPPLLTASDVTQIVQSAAMSTNAPISIAVTDRLGRVLGIYESNSPPATSIGNFGNTVGTDELAVGLARTASFFSNGQAPLSSRTVRYISGIHFPPGIMFTGNAALYGIENTNRGCNDFSAIDQPLPAPRSLDNSAPGLGIITGKIDVYDSDPDAVNPGGVPLYKDNVLVGGIGVAGTDPDTAEFAAFSGFAVFGFAVPDPGVVLINGIQIPFVNNLTPPDGVSPGSFDGSGWVSVPALVCSATADGANNNPGPCDSPGPAPEKDLIVPRDGSMLAAADVINIVNAVVDQGNQTRAAIRLPIGSRARFVIAVADLDGTLLALYRMPDATIFSIDVAVAKARNVAYFSSAQVQPADLPGVPIGTAVTNRTISFGGQPIFPAGIDFTEPGPFFNLYQNDVSFPCTQGSQPPGPNQSGIVFFPGSLPLYSNGVLVGGLGVSGDGVDQDDFATSAGGALFPAPDTIHADNVFIEGVRLPYLKFPRDPTN